ncbi:hypothetical protein N665_0599s0010 [Sinapis alba]|nr:hypothetical protein N665_0599s0010 [Sinapis alba]
MEKWLQSNKIQKEKKLQQAVSAFTEKAYEWWLRENTPIFYNKPVLEWEALKEKMYIDFAKQYLDRKCTTTRIHCQATPKRVLSTQKQQSASKHNNAHAHESRKTSHRLRSLLKQLRYNNSQSLQKLQNQQKLKRIMETLNIREKKPEPKQPAETSQDQTCYRCHKRGHYAATCPLKKVKLLEEKSELSNTIKRGEEGHGTQQTCPMENEKVEDKFLETIAPPTE